MNEQYLKIYKSTEKRHSHSQSEPDKMASYLQLIDDLLSHHLIWAVRTTTKGWSHHVGLPKWMSVGGLRRRTAHMTGVRTAHRILGRIGCLNLPV